MNRDEGGLRYLQQSNHVVDVALQFLPKQTICDQDELIFANEQKASKPI